MSRWGEYTMNAGGSRAHTAHRQRRERFPAFQETGVGSHFMGQGSRGFISPRNTFSEYEQMVDELSDSSTCSPVLPGYIPRGTHAIPTASNSGSAYGNRRPTPRPTGTGHYNNYSSRGSAYLSGGMSRYNMGPIFSDEEEDSFFPPDTLPPIDEFLDYGGGYTGSSYEYPEFDDDTTVREKFDERLASFPEVPTDAHRRIFQMGNEIVDSFEVRLERFYRGSLLDSVPGCVAVFTKKDRTGQRWLMVFKEDISRTVIKFNRLLTHSLLVSVVSSTAIEIEAAKSVYGPPAEMCVINFVSKEDASRFYKTLQESQATAWNHKEVTHEQRMKNIFSKINVALVQADILRSASNTNIKGRAPNRFGTAARLSSSNGDLVQQHNTKRTPFTLTLKGDQLSKSKLSRASHSETEMRLALADLDNDWRRSAAGNGGGDNNNVLIPSVIQAKKSQSGHSTSSSNIKNNIINNKGSKIQQPGIKMDVSGDADIIVRNECFPEDVMYEADATVFVKIDNDFVEVSSGTLQLLDHKDLALNEVRLIDKENSSEIMQQFIYKWNSASVVKSKDDKKFSCTWDGAACFAMEPDAVPDRREYRVKLDSEEGATQFAETFMKGVEKAKDEVIRKRHICWYLQNKREYKPTTAESIITTVGISA